MDTIYILGKRGFRKVVSKRIGKLLPSVIPGQVLDHGSGQECEIFWLPNNVSLYHFKRVIGSDVVWKYRLRFFETADAYYLNRLCLDDCTAQADKPLKIEFNYTDAQL